MGELQKKMYWCKANKKLNRSDVSMRDDIKNKICLKCKRRKYFARVFDMQFDWKNCALKCNKKCADRLKENRNK